MAYKDKGRAKEYQKQYYRNRTKLRRLRGEIEAKRTAYKPKSPEEKAKNYHLGAVKRVEVLKAKLGEEEYHKRMQEVGKRGSEALKATGKPFGFQLGHASEAGKLGAKARGLKSKHKKVREKYEA